MKAEHAWQAALGQLQMDMPKAAYNTWVRDTELAPMKTALWLASIMVTPEIGWRAAFPAL
jgi:chromosomal replication initiator protein